MEIFKLKFKLFNYLKPGFQTKYWNAKQDELLRLTIRLFLILQNEINYKFLKIRNFYPQVFLGSQSKLNWAKISFEISKELENLNLFKTGKQCKERWLNHLNPFLNK